MGWVAIEFPSAREVRLAMRTIDRCEGPSVRRARGRVTAVTFRDAVTGDDVRREWFSKAGAGAESTLENQFYVDEGAVGLSSGRYARMEEEAPLEGKERAPRGRRAAEADLEEHASRHHGRVRIGLFGWPVTSVLRLLCSWGCTSEEAAAVTASLGASVKPVTAGTAQREVRAGKWVATLTAEDEATLRAALPERFRERTASGKTKKRK